MGWLCVAYLFSLYRFLLIITAHNIFVWHFTKNIQETASSQDDNRESFYLFHKEQCDPPTRVPAVQSFLATLTGSVLLRIWCFQASWGLHWPSICYLRLGGRRNSDWCFLWPSLLLLTDFREIERERKRETFMWERNIDQLLPISAPRRDQTCNLGLCPDQKWNR